MLTAVVDNDAVRDALETFDLIPFGSRLFVFEMSLPEKTSGGIILPDQNPVNSEVTVTEGIVLAVGPLVSVVKPKDHVYYAKYSGAKCFWKGKPYRVMNEDDILGVAKEAWNG